MRSQQRVDLADYPELAAGVRLLAGEPSSVDLADHVRRLRELAGRLDLLFDSMTLYGPAATPEAMGAWVEALGWFAGWGLAHALVGSVLPVRS